MFPPPQLPPAGLVEMTNIHEYSNSDYFFFVLPYAVATITTASASAMITGIGITTSIFISPGLNHRAWLHAGFFQASPRLSITINEDYSLSDPLPHAVMTAAIAVATAIMTCGFISYKI